jgi:hypothetical protein
MDGRYVRHLLTTNDSFYLPSKLFSERGVYGRPSYSFITTRGYGLGALVVINAHDRLAANILMMLSARAVPWIKKAQLSNYRSSESRITTLLMEPTSSFVEIAFSLLDGSSRPGMHWLALKSRW